MEKIPGFVDSAEEVSLTRHTGWRSGMLWVNEKKNIWGIIILAVGLVALLGPWVYDLINVPAEFACNAPFVRLEGDYCGLPLSGILIFGGMIGGMVDASAGLMEGGVTLIDWVRGALYSLFLLLIVLPLITTLFRLLRGDTRRRQVFSIAAWGVAIGICLLIGLSQFPRFFWALWGVWLYIVLAVSALVLEVLALAPRPIPSRDRVERSL